MRASAIVGKHTGKKLIEFQNKARGYPPLKECSLEQLKELREYYRSVSIKALKIIIKEIENRL